MPKKSKIPAAQVSRNLKHQHNQALGAEVAADQHDQQVTRGARGPPRLLSKPELLELVGLSYTQVWKLMDRGEFPRSVAISNRTFWYEAEITEYLNNLPRRKLKSDAA